MEIRLLGPGDEAVLASVEPGVFDHAVDPLLAAEFLADPRHHLAVAIDDSVVVGFASAVHFVHPDKPAELWVNEVGVAPDYRRRGIARRLLVLLVEAGRVAGCREAWVLTDRDNTAAMRLYESAGGEEAPSDQVMFSFRLD